MVKKLLSAAAVAMLTLSSFAAQPNINLASVKDKAAAVKTAAKQVVVEATSAGSDYQAPDPGSLKPNLQKSLTQSVQLLDITKDAQATQLSGDKIIGVAKEGGVSSSKSPALKVKRNAGATPKVKLGVLFQEDVNVNDEYYTARLKLEETSESGVYQLTNVYNWDSAIKVKINTETGEVSIPQQALLTHDTYGECSIIPIDIRETGYYLVNGDLKGTLSSDGVITLNSYAIAVTQKEADGTPGKYYGSLFNIFKKSEWKPANAEVASYNVGQDKMQNSEALVDQISENEVVICGLTAIVGLSDPMLARITPDKRILISPQKIYTNLLYGDFNNYPATFELDQSTNAWKVKVDHKSYMVFNDKGNGELALDGYVISAKASPSQYIGYSFKDVKLFLDEDLTYPSPIAMDFAGEGTATSPYLIKTVTDIKALGMATQSGNSLDGVYLALANDIDMSSIVATSYITIGDAVTPFNGKFDGKGYTISNFKANGKGFADTGFFGVLGNDAEVSNIKFTKASVTSSGNDVGVLAGKSGGVIKNISVTSSLLDCDGELGGGIVGETTGGSISDCYFSGAVYSCGSGAGISGESVATEITNCSVDANIILDGATSTLYNKECAGIVGTILRGKITKCYVSGVLEDQKGYGYMGGLAGYSSTSDISESFNTAMIFGKRTVMGSAQSADEGDNYCAGLVGYITDTKLTNCYNSGTIMKPEPSKNVGGLVGYLGVSYVSSGTTPTQMQSVSPIVNCYNSGQVISYYDYAWKGVYGNTFISTSYMGPSPEEKCVVNAYADGQIIGLDYDYNLSTREMTSKLPKDFDPAVWTITEGNYPVLKNTGAGSQAQELSAKPLTLRANDNTNKVKVEFEVAPSNNIGWTLTHNEEEGETATETKALRMEGSKVYVKDQYSNSIVMASSANGWGAKAYQLAIVPKLYDGEGTADDPYLMKTVADYVNLHEAVAKYGQAHTGDYFAMANDIDFEQTENFSGVGYGTTNRFCGTFDGKGKTVHNLHIDAVVVGADGKYVANDCTAYTGLFSTIGEDGKICNVNIASDCSLMNYTYGGAVAGANLGVIENCKNYADVKGITSYIGGIAGINGVGGRILNCYNSGEVSLGTSNGGGITGYSRETGIIRNCQNDGQVIKKYYNPGNSTVKTNTLGGIVGYAMCAVENCVNNAEVIANTAVGGIVGAISNAYNEGAVINCINTGLVTNLEATVDRGALVGKISGECKYVNNVYDGSINVNGSVSNSGNPGVLSMCTSDLVSGEALEGFDAELFDFKANAYPVLKQFANEDAAKALRVMYVGFGKKQLRTNVLTDVPLSKADGLNFKLASAESNFSIDGDVLKVKKPEGNVVASDTIFATLNKYEKSLVLNAVPKILAGDGDKDSPYLIETPADWNKLADFMADSKWEYSGNYFKITNDLDFKGDSIRLVAVDGVNFQADLDGANHTIKGYVYNNINSVKTKLAGPNLYVGKYIGLIGTVGSEGHVANLTIDGDFKCHSYAASMVGDCYGLVENIVNKGKVETVTSGYASGIACRLYTGGVLRNCVNEGEVISKATYAHGIVYSVNGTSVVENCVNKGKVSATTTGAFGIAYTVQGSLKGCHNEGALEANSSIAGIANTLGLNASAEGCYNTADIKARTGGVIAGCFATLTARKSTTEPVGGYVKGCYNTGNLSGTSGVYGLITAANAGWTIEDCYNTGDVSATTGCATGLVYQLKGTAASSTDPEHVYGKLIRSYNTGNVKGNAAGCAGLISDASKMTYVLDCYNLGNVENLTTTGLTTGGLVAKHNGIMERCFNAGDVISGGNSIGGLFGYIAAGDPEMEARVSNCFNIGDIVSTYTGTNTNGNAGGLGGYLSSLNTSKPHVVENCYNTGNVTANQRVGGLFAGAFNPESIVKNCYSSGKVTCLQPDSQGRYYWSGTTFTNNYTKVVGKEDVFMLAGHENCFYDKTVNPTGQFRNVPNSAKTTDELRKLVISDAFVNPDHGGFPILKDFADYDESHAGSALILLSGTDTDHSLVKNTVTLVGPDGCEWAVYDVDATGKLSETTSSLMTIKNNQAVPNGKGDVALKCTYKGLSKHYFLTVEGSGSMVDETFAAKEVKSVEYINLGGQKVAQPEPGQVYLVRTIYVDGTMNVEKKLAK